MRDNPLRLLVVSVTAIGYWLFVTVLQQYAEWSAFDYWIVLIAGGYLLAKLITYVVQRRTDDTDTSVE